MPARCTSHTAPACQRRSRTPLLGFVSLVLGLLTSSGSALADWAYTVRQGDTLYLISERFNVDLNSLRRANGLWTDAINPGDQLTIPTSGGGSPGNSQPWQRAQPYTIQPGDTLFLIAQRFGVAMFDLRQVNNLWTDRIYPGMRLLVPQPAPPPTDRPVTEAPPGITQSEYDLLARLVTAEADGEPLAGQVAVAATVLNRVADPRFPGSIAAVINQVSDGYYQYSPVLDGRIQAPATEAAYRAVRAALSGWDPSGGANGFYNPAKTGNAWVRQQPVTAVIGNHVFFRS